MRQDSRKTINKYKIIIYILLIGIVLVFCSKFQITRVSGQSMEPTLRNRQIVLVEKCKEKYETNNIITFTSNNYGVCVKRIKGVSGDTIELKNGKIYRNGIELSGYVCDEESAQTFILKENELFVLGDNANESIDSRLYGPINVSDVIGKVLAN